MRKTETETNNYRSQYWGLMAKKNWAKGRAAEKIVEEMFEELGFSVHKYGVEHSLPSFSKLLRKRKKNTHTKIEKKISTMPDFVVDHEKKGTFFIEVKYSKDGELKPPTDYQHEGTFFVVISKKFIQCISISEYEEGCRINDDEYQREFLLGYRNEFDFNVDERATIRKYHKRSAEEIY
jgi:hypothetical protein